MTVNEVSHHNLYFENKSKQRIISERFWGKSSIPRRLTLAVISDNMVSVLQSYIAQEKSPDKKSSCSCDQETSYTEPTQRLLSATEVVTWTLPSNSTEQVPREVPSQLTRAPRHSHFSLDDLWIEKTQRSKLEKQLQLRRKTCTGTAHSDQVQVSQPQAGHLLT